MRSERIKAESDSESEESGFTFNSKHVDVSISSNELDSIVREVA